MRLKELSKGKFILLAFIVCCILIAMCISLIRSDEAQTQNVEKELMTECIRDAKASFLEGASFYGDSIAIALIAIKLFEERME